MTLEAELRGAMLAAGLDYCGPIVADGGLRRFKAEGDHNRNSWYVLHIGPPSAGAFGCWKRGIRETWCGGNGHLSQAEWQGVRRRWQEAEQQRKRTEADRQRKAQATAAWILNRSRPVPALHRYLARKGVKPFGNLREWRSALVLPLCAAHGVLHSLQFIREDGSKRFLTGGRIAGCFYMLADKPDGALVLCEGYATGASIHEATGLAVVCAMHAGNLAPVAESLRAMSPAREIIIAADNDQFTDGNPGLTKATEAARTTRAKIAVPQFQDLAAKPADFNDLHNLRGIAEVARQIQTAIAVTQRATVDIAPDLHAGPPQKVSRPIITLREDDGPIEEPEAAPFPVASLAPAMGSLVAAVSRCERVPPALPAVCALGVMSAAIGAGLEVLSATNRPTRANLFLLASAESGSGKSEVFRQIAAPIVEHQHRLHEVHKTKTAPQAMSEIAVLKLEAAKIEKEAAKSRDPMERDRLIGQLTYKNAQTAELQHKSMVPCIICGDVTSEKLAALLSNNRETLFSASPEARQIVDIVCGRYSSTKSTDEAIYCSAWSGDLVRVDRLGRDPITLRRPCLTNLWLLQPDALGRLFDEDTLAESGFLPRFLIAPTKAIPRKIEGGEPPTISEYTMGQWGQLITRLLATYHTADSPFQIQPDSDARLYLNAFFNSIIDRRNGELADVGQFAARYGEQAWRVALVLHAALYGAEAHNQSLTLEIAEHAVALVEWFIAAQLDVLARSRRKAAKRLEDEVRELIDSNRIRKGQDFTTARDVQRARIVATAEAAKALLERMEADGLLTGEDVTPEGGGRTTCIYRGVGGHNPVPG